MGDDQPTLLEQSAHLLADGLQINTQTVSVKGPPFELHFALLPGASWPEMALLILASGTPVWKIVSTEPRLHELFSQLAEATE